ncbi:MAG: hypothetical protein HOP14_01970 [Acidobacteria bacterium]|nr:hypothetical protein [Acidobacteriota bacterium]
MSLQVIGPGFGRTGTMSLKMALQELGFGPCHHMEEVFMHPEQVPQWQALAEGRPVDWHAVFAGYRSQVDWPGAHAWRELVQAYPEARVVLTVRPEDAWWNSFSKTIGRFCNEARTMPLPPHVQDMVAAFITLVGEGTFAGQWNDRDVALAAYRRRIEKVRGAVPAERLLVYDVAQGWEPLCRFLGVAVPDTAFPHRNTTTQFWELISGDPPQ